MISEWAGSAQVLPRVTREAAESSPHSPSATGALGTYHTAPHTVPGVYRWLLGGGLTTNPRKGRNPTSGTFSGRAGSNNPFLLREQSACLFWHPPGCSALATPRWPFAGSCYSAKGRPLQGAAPRSPGDPSPPQRPGLRKSPRPSRQGPSCPLDPLRLLGQPSSGIPASQPPLGKKGPELAGPAAWLLFQPPGERER